MKNAVFAIALAAALTGCGGGERSPEPAATAPSPPAAPAKAEPVPQPVDHANIDPQPESTAKPVQPTQHEPIMKPKQAAEEKIVRTDAEWRAKLTPEEYHILRRKGTERPFTGKFDPHFKDGTYTCKGCGTPLFLSDTKYNSGCGWPAFFKSIDNTIDETRDNSLGMVRIEITCKKCGGHLGHVFDDGPNPTGLRYCVNSASMDFIPAAGKVEKRQ
ncbi:MAG: peptide-methionine (R)-S-oxide reductase MsrB [Verrucomicrobia bacterium]|nr:peptide-methionine (R)-S-oxide reductase MsrB [Verrucomicrobiota bacterium]